MANFELFDEDWDEVIEGDFIFLSREFPPNVYLIRKVNNIDTEIYKFDFFRKRDKNRKYIKLKRFDYDNDKIILINDFNNKHIKDYIDEILNNFRNNFQDEKYLDIINNIEKKINNKDIYDFINNIINNIKKIKI